MQTEHNENVLDYWSLPNGNYIVKIKTYVGVEGDNDMKIHCQVIQEVLI